jgi:acetyl esterase/lipase
MDDAGTLARRLQINVVYGMHSGLALLMDVYQPRHGNGYGVIYINGSGWHAPLAYDAQPLKQTPLGLPYIEAMRAGGYTVFAINHRAAPRFRYPCPLEDAQRAVRFIRHHAGRFGVRPDRIGACGGSSGGHLVSLLGTLPGAGDPDDPDLVNREHARVQCVVARAPPVDLTRFAGTGGSCVVDGFIGMLVRGEADGAYPTEHRTYREASPINHVSGSAPPFLLIHGNADEIVPYEQSELMQAALKAVGVPVQLVCIEGARHGPDFPGANTPPEYLDAMVRWFDRHLRAAGAAAHNG